MELEDETGDKVRRWWSLMRWRQGVAGPPATIREHLLQPARAGGERDGRAARGPETVAGDRARAHDGAVREFLKKTGMERTLSVFDHEISTGAAHADGHDNALLPHTLDAPSVVDGLEVPTRQARRPRRATCKEPKDLPLLSGLVHLNTPAMALRRPTPSTGRASRCSGDAASAFTGGFFLVGVASGGRCFLRASGAGWFRRRRRQHDDAAPQQQQVALPIMMRRQAATNDNSTSLEHEHEKPDGDTVSGGGSGGENDDPSLEEHPAKASKRGSVVLDGQVLTRSQMKTKEAEYEETRGTATTAIPPTKK